MIRKLTLVLALAAAATASVQASPMSAGEERYFNFSRTSNGPFTGVWFTPISVDATNTLVLEFYSGLNLTGTLMGRLAGSGDVYDFGAGSGLADGDFSLLVRQTAGSPGFGDSFGNVAAYWTNAGGYAGASGGVAATDDRPPVTTPPTGGGNNVPEPGSLWLCLAAGVALGAVRHRRRAQR